MAKAKANSEGGKIIIQERFKSLKESKGTKEIADNLGEFLIGIKPEVSISVIKGCIDKHVPLDKREIFNQLLSNPELLEIFNKVNVSYSNTMKPLAGGQFAELVCSTLNDMFVEADLNLRCSTSGKYKKIITDLLNKKSESKYNKPDIDIVLYDSSKFDESAILGIISCKTTLAERVGQTINWKDYLTESLGSTLPVYLVTSGWGEELNNPNNINRERVQALSGVFVTSENTIEYGNIKKLSSALEEFKKLIK
jgi:hypothetical protein